MPPMLMQHDQDPAEVIFKAIGMKKPGVLPGFEIFANRVLVGVYKRPEKTKSQILLPDQTRDEDKYQGKVGLIVKLGPTAFKDASGGWQWPDDIGLGDWVYYRASDGWALAVNQVECRQLDDMDIRGRVDEPDKIW